MRKYFKLLLSLLIAIFVINLISPLLAIIGWIVCVILVTLIMFAILTYIGIKYKIKLFR